LKRLPHQFLAHIDVPENLIPKDEEAAVYPNVRLAQSGDLADVTVWRYPDDVEACSGLNQEQRPNGLGSAELFDHQREIEIAQAVTVVGQKHFFTLYVRLYRFEALTNRGVDARLNKSYGPVVDVSIDKANLFASL
jgi:hypothetical protein